MSNAIIRTDAAGLLIVVAQIALFVACAGEPRSERPIALKSDGVVTELERGRNLRPYESVDGPSGSQRLLSLCEVAAMLDGAAGVYHVNSLTGVTEADDAAATYVDLSLMEDWTGDAPKSIIARISGGPTADPKITALWRVSLAKGEDVGLVLGASSPRNKGYPTIHNLGVFRAKPGKGASNGQLFTNTNIPLTEVGARVGRLRAALKAGADPKKCPDDVAADYYAQAPEPPAERPGDIPGPVEHAESKPRRTVSAQEPASVSQEHKDTPAPPRGAAK